MPIPFILGEVRVFEFFLYISFIFYFPKVFRKKVKLIKLDKLVYFYFILSLISTLVDLANIYDGLQSFRWTVLPPVIFYIIIRSEFKNISYYTKYITIMLPGILLYAILFIKDKALSDFTRSYVDEHGTIRLISLAYCFALGLSILQYLIKINTIRILTAILLIIALSLTLTRAIIIGTLIMFFFNYLLSSFTNYKLNLNKNYLAIVIFSFFFFLLNYTKSESDIYDKRELRMLQQGSERMISFDLLKEDINDRLFMWRLFLDPQFDHNFLVGKGLANTTIGFNKDLEQVYGSAHNFMITLFRRSGLLGVLLFISIITTSVNYLFYSLKFHRIDNSFLKFLLFNLLLLYFLGFSNDLFTGNRITYLFIILGFTSNCYVHTKNMKHNIL